MLRSLVGSEMCIRDRYRIVKQLPPLREIYSTKRRACYQSVQSFKYPFTSFSQNFTSFLFLITDWFRDLVTIVKLYEMSYVAVRTIDDIADEHDPYRGLDHLNEVLDFLSTTRDAVSKNEILLQHIFDSSSLVGRDITSLQEAFINIFTEVRNDAARRISFVEQNLEIRDEKRISEYVHTMELDGIFKLIFTLFGCLLYTSPSPRDS